MTRQSLNEKFLLDDGCFGCGLGNPIGLRMKVFTDPDDPARIVGEFCSRADLIGFPGLTHGGVVFTALDCMASWAGMALAEGPRALWVLRSADVTYHRPVPVGESVSLAASIPEPSRLGRPQTVHNEARSEGGEILVRGRYRIFPMSAEKFKTSLGLDELPSGCTAWLTAFDESETK